MIDAINQARLQARRAMELLYEHTCTVIEYRKVKNPVTKITEMKEIAVLENQPCKLSFSTIKSSEQTESANQVNQVIKLFIAPEVEIKEGSKLVITHNGKVSEYKNSGVPSIFPTHQEIVLELFKGWS
ncbi:hypothetical protein [Cellulosilyticum sp. WCF-2]|uniref:hypothetical protein n=1 Tax=Cellulosilyticum sp. WCF-2 TaxID=2497860 RepID=UPI000F8D7C63|nr:hypothetical protein [Cellulosilyticum sp. WCF-2]QEH69920.1 hypothetical protein EKH84_16575 [Cellulosilyticum sp. WCF-2]